MDTIQEYTQTRHRPKSISIVDKFKSKIYA